MCHLLNDVLNDVCHLMYKVLRSIILHPISFKRTSKFVIEVVLVSYVQIGVTYLRIQS